MERVVQTEKKIKSLQSKHQYFDKLIKKETYRLNSDSLKILTLKKKKLFIRDQIAKLKKT
ncbi:MAG: DUF465 domain-containing protein [Rickettsiales bacterium]|nr:DUF465 domain-containing protein [Rickettsiales bacterium]|tara:strand:- start:74 stop:253 length:180 start_codon:yes stop_codon:yes gene_type:complete